MDKTLGGKDESRCGADGFMMRDGVCDELTNTPQCLWDGGDCCLGRTKKDTTMCKICTCRVTVDHEALSQTFIESKVMRFNDPSDFELAVLRTEKTVDDVLTLKECSTLCSDSSVTDVVNAWRYNAETSTCTCSWLKSTYCLDLSRAEEEDYDNGLIDSYFDFNIVTAFAQTGKILACGMCKKVW